MDTAQDDFGKIVETYDAMFGKSFTDHVSGALRQRNLLSVTQQYKSGVRYLEICACIDSNCTIPLSKLKCCHGFFSNDEGLILQEVNDSCLQNISELVIFKFVSLYLGMDGETAGEFAHFN